MEQIDFKAKVAYAKKNREDNCYELGFADDKYDYENYILFQRPIELDADDDPNAEENGIFAECNGGMCFNDVARATLSDSVFEVETSDSVVTVDLTGVKVDKKLVNNAQAIFGDLIRIDIAQ